MITTPTQRQVVLFFKCPLDDVARTVNELSEGREIVSISHQHLDTVNVSVLMVVRGRIEEMTYYEARMAERLGVEESG